MNFRMGIFISITNSTDFDRGCFESVDHVGQCCCLHTKSLVNDCGTAFHLCVLSLLQAMTFSFQWNLELSWQNLFLVLYSFLWYCQWNSFLNVLCSYIILLPSISSLSIFFLLAPWPHFTQFLFSAVVTILFYFISIVGIHYISFRCTI